MFVKTNALTFATLLTLGFFAHRGIKTLTGVMNSPRVEVICSSGQGFYSQGHLVVNADEGSNAFAAYTHEGDLVKIHAMPWEFGPDHDLWVEDCVREIEAAAAQQ